jgi:hypothetical protein
MRQQYGWSPAGDHTSLLHTPGCHAPDSSSRPPVSQLRRLLCTRRSRCACMRPAAGCARLGASSRATRRPRCSPNNTCCLNTQYQKLAT